MTARIFTLEPGKTYQYSSLVVISRYVTREPDAWYGRVHRGLLFGVKGIGYDYSPVWAGVDRDSQGYYQHMLPPPTVSASDAQIRDFFATGTLPVRAVLPFEDWLRREIARGTRSADVIPLELHAIEDPLAREAAIRAYRKASEYTPG